MRSVLIVLFGTACAGCVSGPPARPDPPKLDEARNLGRTLPAVEKYAELYEGASADDEAVLEARAQILVELHALGAPALLATADETRRARVLERIPASTDADLLTAALGHSARAMSKTVLAEQHLSCAARQAEILQMKLATPSLRRWTARNPFEELVYRRLMLETIAAYHLFALVRQPSAAKSGDRAAAALEELADACKALSDHPATNSNGVKYWDSLAAQTRTLALQVRAKPADFKIDSESRGLAEGEVDGHLKIAARAHDDAVGKIAGREAVALALKSLEDALRHAMLAREMILTPTGRQQDAMQTARIGMDLLSGQALKP